MCALPLLPIWLCKCKSTGIKDVLLHLALHGFWGDSNSGPHAYIASTLCPEPSPHLFFFVCVREWFLLLFVCLVEGGGRRVVSQCACGRDHPRESVLLPSHDEELTSGCQAWQQVSSPTEPFLQPLVSFEIRSHSIV